MDPISLEQYYANPDLEQRLQAAARRERARAISAGLAWLRDRIVALRLPHSRPARWLARVG